MDNFIYHMQSTSIACTATPCARPSGLGYVITGSGRESCERPTRQGPFKVASPSTSSHLGLRPGLLVPVGHRRLGIDHVLDM